MSVDQAPSRSAARPSDGAKLVRYHDYIDEKIENTRRLVKVVDLATTLVALVVAVLLFLLLVVVADHWVVRGGISVGAMGSVRRACDLCRVFCVSPAVAAVRAGDQPGVRGANDRALQPDVEEQSHQFVDVSGAASGYFGCRLSHAGGAGGPRTDAGAGRYGGRSIAVDSLGVRTDRCGCRGRFVQSAFAERPAGGGRTGADAVGQCRARQPRVDQRHQARHGDDFARRVRRCVGRGARLARRRRGHVALRDGRWPDREPGNSDETGVGWSAVRLPAGGRAR